MTIGGLNKMPMLLSVADLIDEYTAPGWHQSNLVRVLVVGEEEDESEYRQWLKGVHGHNVEIILNPPNVPFYNSHPDRLFEWIVSHFDNAAVYIAGSMLAPVWARLGQLTAPTQDETSQFRRFGIIVRGRDLVEYIGADVSGIYHVAEGQTVHVWLGKGPTKPGIPREVPLF